MEEMKMILRYKEIFYGVLFGLGAVVIDVVMHSRMSNRSLWEGLTTVNPEMMFYRVLFLVFGSTTGWFMWRSNQRERDFRALEDRFSQFRSRLAPLVTMTYSRLQLALTHPESDTLSKELAEALQAVYQDLRRLKSAISDEGASAC